MTWHCMLDRFATVVSALGVVRRWAAGGMAMSAVSDVAAAPLREVLGSAGPVSVLPNGIDVVVVAAAWLRVPTTASSGSSRRCGWPSGSGRSR